MNDDQRRRLARIRNDLQGLALEMRNQRQGGPQEEKAGIRASLRRFDHADAQLAFAEQDDDRRRRKGTENGR